MKDILRQAGQRGDRREAEVLVELHQGGRVVTLRLPGQRVAIDDHLISGVKNVLARAVRGHATCELIGQPRLSVTPTNRHDTQQDTKPKLAMTSSQSQQEGEVCASVDRY